MFSEWLRDLHEQLARYLDVSLCLAPLQQEGACVCLEDTNLSLRGATIVGEIRVLLMMDPLNIEAFEGKKRILMDFFNHPHVFGAYRSTFRLKNSGTKWSDKKITAWATCDFLGSIERSLTL